MKKLLLSLLTLVSAATVSAQGSADFATLGNASTNYTTRTTTNGWVCNNCAVVSINNTVAPTLNGKTTAVGSITSPVLENGLGSLSFKYANTYSENKGVSLRIDIKQNGAVVDTETLTNTSVKQSTVYEFTSKNFDLSGDFTIVITNLSPSNSTSNKDRVSIWDLTWTGYGQAAAVAKPEFTPDMSGEAYLLTITAEEGAQIHYTIDGTDPTTESELYLQPLALWESCTVKAIAVKDGQSSSVATFEANVPYFLDSFAELVGNLDFVGAKIVVNAQIQVVDQPAGDTRYLYVQSGSSKMLIYNLGKTLQKGDTFNHLEATVGQYGNQIQLTNAVIGEVTAGTPVEPMEMTLDEVAVYNVYSYFKIPGVTITKDGSNYYMSSEDAENIQLYDRFKIGIEELKGCTVTGFVATYNGNVQFYPTEIEAGEVFVPAPTITPADGSTIPNYSQIFITTEDDATIYYKTSLDEDFEEYYGYLYAQGAVGSQFTVEAYAELDGVKSETVKATYTFVKAEPGVQWLNQSYEPITEFVWIMGESTIEELPLMDGIMETPIVLSSNPDVASYNELWYENNLPWLTIVGPGTTILTVISPENDEYAEGRADLTFIVEDPNAPKPIVETIVFANQTWEKYSKDQMTINWVAEETATEFETTLTMGTGTAYPQIYSDGLRIYGKANANKITVNAPEGMQFTAVSAIADASKKTPQINGEVMSGADGSYSYTLSEPATSFVLSSLDDQARISRMGLTIEPIPTTAVGNINAADANAPVEYYNLQGIRVENPAKGLYIRRQGNTATKVIL